MKNWIGQEIEVGSVVWRGARSGNTSSFKVGRVIEYKPGDRPRVHWLYEQGGWPYESEPRSISTLGSPSVHSLALVDPATLGVDI